MSTLTVELPDELASRLEAARRSRSVPTAQVIRELVANTATSHARRTQRDVRMFREWVERSFHEPEISRRFRKMIGQILLDKAIIRLAILSLALCYFVQAEDIDLPRLVKGARPAVLLLTVFDSAGKAVATGTGFFVSTDGKLITNWHVAKDAHGMEAKVENGTVYKIRGVLAASPKDDLALLQAEASQVPALHLASAASSEVGSRIAVIGSPLGLEGTLSDGIISAKRKLGGDEAWMQITAPISPGSSGSPVLNAKGDVVGVATMYLRESQALNFASPSDAVTRLLDESVKQTHLKTFAEARREAAAKIWDDPNVKAALQAVRESDDTEALRRLRLALKEHPDATEVWHLQGVILATQEFFKDAVPSLKKAMS